MTRTIDDKTSEVFKIYDELRKNYSNELDSCKEIIKSVEVMIQQKEKILNEINERTIQLMQKIVTSCSTTIQEDKIYNYAGVEVEDMAPQVTQTETPPAVEAINSAAETILTEPVPVIKTRPLKQQKETGDRKGKVKSKVLAANKSEPENKSFRSTKTEKQSQVETKITCQYHPQAPAADMKRQLCASCSWKIKAYGLKEHLNDPAVVSYLKGETTSVPNVGQAMCPVHPTKPSYNKKTGLCQYCHSKARVIGVTDRKLDDEELEIVRGPVAW